MFLLKKIQPMHIQNYIKMSMEQALNRKCEERTWANTKKKTCWDDINLHFACDIYKWIKRSLIQVGNNWWSNCFHALFFLNWLYSLGVVCIWLIPKKRQFSFERKFSYIFNEMSQCWQRSFFSSSLKIY